MRDAIFELRGRVGFQSELAECLDELSKKTEMSISTADGKPRLNPADTQIEAEFWAFGQHYGLATPLLDWTLAPGVALFFAVEKPPQIPRHMAAVFAINKTLVSSARDKRGVTVDFVTPIRLANPRISAQRGLFTLCSRDIPVEDWISEAFEQRGEQPVHGHKQVPALFKLIFPLTEKDRRSCMMQLRDRNITHSSVYPDIQGATDHANLLLREKLYPTSSDKPGAVESKAQNADIGLVGRTIQLTLSRDDTGRIIKITAARLVDDAHPISPRIPNGETGNENWRVETLVQQDTLPRQAESWAHRAGCAYKLVSHNRYLFLKTPDKRHFNKGSLADIRASFSEEEKNLRTLNDEPRAEPLRVAKVIASVELEYSREYGQDKELPEDGKFPVLIHDYIAQKEPLDQLLARASSSPLDAESWLTLAESLTDTLRRVHNSSVLHAAIALRHVLVKDLSLSALQNAYLVGFGASSLLSEAGIANASFSRPQSPWLAPEVHETEDLLGPLSFSTDIYSLGMVLLSVGTRKRPEEFQLEKHQHTTLLKRRVTDLLAAAINGKPNPIAQRHDIAKIIDTCLRHDPNERYSCMEELLDAIRAAKRQRSSNKGSLVSALHKIEALTTGSEKEPSAWDKLHLFFKPLLQRQVDRVYEEFINKVKNGHYEVYGNRNTLIDYLCNFMNLVEDGGVYRTVTLPGYWTDRNLGSDGRFLAKNKDLLSKRVTVERIFLVSGPFHTLPYPEQQVLLAHYSAWAHLRGEHRDRFKIYVTIKPSRALMSFEKGGQAVAIIQPKSHRHNAISLRFLSTGKRFQHGGEYFIDREIRKLRFKVIPGDRLAYEIERMGYSAHLSDGVALDKFVHQQSAESIQTMLAAARPSA